MFFFGIFCRSNFKKISFGDFYDMYTKQSQNASLRASLAVSDVYQSIQETHNKKFYNWLELKDQYLCVIHYGLTYYSLVFFANALQRAVQELYDSGIIQHIFNTDHNSKPPHPPPENSPNVLSLHDLSFGFYIWIGTFCICIVVFLIEFSMWMCRKDKSKRFKYIRNKESILSQIKHNRVHPAVVKEIDDRSQRKSVNPETLLKFRMPSKPVTDTITEEEL
jgi:hypothetical protein